MATTPSESAGAGVRIWMAGAVRVPGSGLVRPRSQPRRAGTSPRQVATSARTDGASTGAVPTPLGYVEVRVVGSQVEIDSRLPVDVVHEDGTELDLPAGQGRATNSSQKRRHHISIG